MIAHLGSLQKINNSSRRESSNHQTCLKLNKPAESFSILSSSSLPISSRLYPTNNMNNNNNNNNNTLYVVTISIPNITNDDDNDDDETNRMLDTCHNNNKHWDTSSQQQYLLMNQKKKKNSSSSVLFSQEQYDTMSRLFCILDTDNQGFIDWKTMFDFLILRCPLFRKRDLYHSSSTTTTTTSNNNNTLFMDWMISPIVASSSPTFNEIWILTILCSSKTISSSFTMTHNTNTTNSNTNNNTNKIQLGIEGWMIFCRFIQIAQYYERKRSFSDRHVQQSMQHKKEGKNSEVIFIQVPPPDPSTPLTYDSLVELSWYDVPTLEIDFSFQVDEWTCGYFYKGEEEGEVDYDYYYSSEKNTCPIRPETYQGKVTILDFQSTLLTKSTQQRCTNNNTTTTSSRSRLSSFSSSSSSNKNKDCDFVLSFYPLSMKYTSSFHSNNNNNNQQNQSCIITQVKRSLQDFIWLHEIFLMHKIPGDVLWGRIIPPFPIDLDSSSSSFLFLQEEDTSTSSHRIQPLTTFTSIAKSAAKSLFGDSMYKTTKSLVPPRTTTRSWLSNSLSSSSSSNHKYQHAWREESCIPIAFERYFNYILECPILSLSFPVHVLLRASGAGLECAKRFMSGHRRDESKPQISSIVQESGHDGISSSSSSSQRQIIATTNKRARKSWIRSAAQAAVSIHVHAILESAGHSTASVKLQHASMPYIASSKGRHDEDSDIQGQLPTSGNRLANLVSEFESGVISVESELDVDEWGDQIQMNGYDLLPSPLTPSERSALCAGKIIRPSTLAIQDDGGFLYGEFECSKNPDDSSLSCPPTLGDVSLDSDINRLRDIIYGLKNDLEKCLVSIVTCDDATRMRADLHLRIIAIIDDWEGMRGQFLSQKSLLQGASYFNTSLESYVTSTDRIIQDVSWQVSLASSAVTAANEVRCTFQASKTATSAKEAVDLAYKRAADLLDTISDAEDSKIAQVKISTLKQQAIHSAIVEYEAQSAKHNSSTALAHDVRTWNIHRKRQVFNACLDIATSQQKYAHQLTQAWGQLQDGLINHSPVMDVNPIMCILEPFGSSASSQVSPLLISENEHEVNKPNTKNHDKECDSYLQELMLADKNGLFMDTYDLSAYDDIVSSGSILNAKNLTVANIQMSQCDQTIDENKQSLSYENSSGKDSGVVAYDSDEILNFRSLSFEDVGPQPLIVHESNEENLIYSTYQTTEGAKSHLKEYESVNDNLSPLELLKENDPSDTNNKGTLTRMNSMESLINGLMTWAPNDIDEITFPLDFIG